MTEIETILNWYNIEIIQELDEDEDCYGFPIRRFDCKIGNESVTAEYYVEGNQIDIYYTFTDETIYNGELKNINK